MSTVKANNYQDASGGSNAQLFGVASPPNSMGFRNRIINGAMVIDQRNAGASITPTDGQLPVDRWKASLNVSSKFSLQRSTVAPAGFTNSLLATSLSAYTVASGDVTGILQPIEGFNIADFGWGAAGAQTVTVSFWVRSSLTGTFGGSLRNSASNRSYPFSYSISAANTWEQKTITIAGDTTGTWLTDNGIGVMIYFSLGAGSTFSSTAGSWQTGNFISATGATSVVGTNGATFYITGVQLEAGTVASPFERRPYGTELALCQRYYYRETSVGIASTFAIGFNDSTTSAVGTTFFPVTMRTAPSALEQTGTAGDYRVRNTAATSTTCSAVPSIAAAGTTPYSVVTSFTVASGLTAGQGAFLQAVNATAYLGWSAEL